MKLIDDCEELQMVELPGWAGLGGVRYGIIQLILINC